ncbi:MAG: hypothetical protein RIM83_05850 [Allomuricauda sp.]
MTNPYKLHLVRFFETITDFKHTSNRLNKVLLKDVDRYTAEEAKYFSGTALVINDWTESTNDEGRWKFHTGVQKTTLKENYANEINKVLSREFGLIFAQCYEAFETLLKDFIDVKIHSDEDFKNSLRDPLNYSRKSLRGGDCIFDLIKKGGGKRFKKYSSENNKNFKFKEAFKIFSEIRHAITHSQGKLDTSKIPKDNYYQKLFKHFMPMNVLADETIQLKFEYKTLDRLLTYFAEFGYQIFKIFSEEDNYEWKI